MAHVRPRKYTTPPNCFGYCWISTGGLSSLFSNNHKICFTGLGWGMDSLATERYINVLWEILVLNKRKCNIRRFFFVVGGGGGWVSLLPACSMHVELDAQDWTMGTWCLELWQPSCSYENTHLLRKSICPRWKTRVQKEPWTLLAFPGCYTNTKFISRYLMEKLPSIAMVKGPVCRMVGWLLVPLCHGYPQRPSCGTSHQPGLFSLN